MQKSSRGARTLSRTLSFRKARGAPPSGLDSVMVSLEGGEFLMGSNDTAELYPVGRCKLDPSWKAPSFPKIDSEKDIYNSAFNIFTLFFL